MELNRLELFVKILNVTNINVNILKNDKSNLELIDNRFRLHLYQNYIYDDILDLLESQKEANLLFRITDDFLFTYFFLHIPEEYISEDETTWISVGPLSEGRRSPDDIYHIVQKNRIPERLFQEISSFYDTVPVIESVSQYGEFIQELASGLFSRKYRLEYLPADCVLFCNSASIYKTVRDNPQMAMTSIAERYEVEDLTLNRLAEMFNISKTYLSNLFRRETGVTLTEYIHQVRMRKAITLINSSALPVAAIATACGYNDINYFTRIFKRTYGLSPKQYQKSVMHGGV